MYLQLACQDDLPELALIISHSQLPLEIYSIDTMVGAVYSSSTYTLTSYFSWFSLIKSPITTIWSDEYSKLQCMVWTKFWLLYHPEPPTQGEVIKMTGSPGQTRPLMWINMTSSWEKICKLIFFQILVSIWWHWVSKGHYLLVLGGTGSVLDGTGW